LGNCYKIFPNLKQFGNPELNGGGGWGIFNAILGWTNSATYGSVISYNLYWIFVIAGFILMRFKEVNGHYPFLKEFTKKLASKKAEKERKTRAEKEAKEQTDSPGSSQLFHGRDSTEKDIAEVRAEPVRSITE
jgi:high-affinity iron transporter